VVAEHGEGDERTLDTDWFIELRSQADGGPVERRRERVELQMKKEAGKWKIAAMAPFSILDPIHIQ
jgi:ketosteroid isomerase-like protein